MDGKVLWGIIIAHVLLAAFVVWRVQRGDDYTRDQKTLQSLLACLLPFFGSLMILYALRQDSITHVPPTRGGFHDPE